MDANLYQVHRRLGEDGDKLTTLAKCVYKLMKAAAVRCEEHGIDREEWDDMASDLADVFNYEVY